MATHLTARLSWHDDGWNGRICSGPVKNTYCVGFHSYPGQHIAEARDLDWETLNAGKRCKAGSVPPCCYSYNAFGLEQAPAQEAPPVWFNDDTQVCQWTLPPSTMCIWPYEEMYGEDVREGDGYNYDLRLEKARKYFADIRPGQSLIFYYANYSNPFSEEDANRYVLVGLSRIKQLGTELFYEGCSERILQRYKGFVWQRPITSYYPDQGFRIPYHLYRDRPEILERLILFPENPRLCKYATRHLSDDDALGFVEAFLRVAKTLVDIGDQSENWAQRVDWLEGLIAELWCNRGLFPGMSTVLDVFGLRELIPYFKEQALRGNELKAYESIFALVEGRSDSIRGVALSRNAIELARRRWRLAKDRQQLLKDCLPRFELDRNQIENIASDKRAQNGITASLESIGKNPYLLSEQYVGNGPDDTVPWGVIDRGMIPSPHLGGPALAEKDDPRRLRALVVDVLKADTVNVFLPVDEVIDRINRRLSVLPDWKRVEVNSDYVEADEDVLSEAVHIDRRTNRVYLYLREAYDDERLIEKEIGFLVGGPSIEFRIPVTEEIWRSYLYDPTSALAQKAPKEYEEAIDAQIDACLRVFPRPLSVLAGEAGTGKTTVIRALIRAIRRVDGIGTRVVALAPTGKAAERIRDILADETGSSSNVEVSTIHSFLAKGAWLNPNMTFKRTGGRQESSCPVFIVDETSMLDLSLAASFMRAVNWNSVRRLILVGDPHQLPPIGRGRVYADIIEYVRTKAPESIAVLDHNLRQLLGRVTGGGTGIIDLAKCYIHSGQQDTAGMSLSTFAEVMLRKVQQGGDVDKDLRVLYWRTQDELDQVLEEEVFRDLASDVRTRGDTPKHENLDLWCQAFDKNPAYMQVLTPYRGEFYGVEELNRVCQEFVHGRHLDESRALEGITFFDKVIQIRNRPHSSRIKAYNFATHQTEPIEVFNGQLGFVYPHLFDRQSWRNPYKQLRRIGVSFARREGYSVGYGRGLGTNCPDEPVGDNLELAYAVSVHKAQGTEFDRTYVIIPKDRQTLLHTEMFYTALTRAGKHCTLLIEQDISPLLEMRRLESSKLGRIRSSLLRTLVVASSVKKAEGWHEDGLVHQTLAGNAVRSKSEVIIANILFEREIPFKYEWPLYGPDGSMYLPDFTITWRGTEYYWEHLGLLDKSDYRDHWDKKKIWYDKHFPGRLVSTEEGRDLSLQAKELIEAHFR